MGLEKVAQEITEEAEKNALKVTEAGQKEAEKILLEAKEKARELEKKISLESEKKAHYLRSVELSSFELELNRRLLLAKKKALEEIFAMAEKEIENLDKKKRHEIVMELCKKALKELPDAKYVYSSPHDKKSISSIKALSFAGSIESIGGIIMENPDKTIRVNYTFEEILEKAREENLHETAKRVFGKN